MTRMKSSTEPGTWVENCCEQWGWDGEGLEHSVSWFLGARRREDGGITNVTLLSFFPSSVPPFFLASGATVGPRSLYIIKVSKPHLTSSNEAALLPCTDQHEGRLTFRDWHSKSRWSREVSGTLPGICPGSSPLLHLLPWMTGLEDTLGQCRVLCNLEL